MKTIDRGKFLFVLSLCLTAFGAGLAAMEFKTFPYSLIKEARSSASALLKSFREEREHDVAVHSKEKLSQPTVRRHAGAAGDELILVAGGRYYQKSVSPDYGALAWIMDRDGKVKHVWHQPADLWDDVKGIVQAPGNPIYPVGVHVYPNGDLLALFQAAGSWPYGVGVAKFDKDSKLLWKHEFHNHHWMSVGDDGRIYIPSQEAVEAPRDLGDRMARLPGKEGKILTDAVMVLDPDGTVLDRILMIDVLVDSDRIGLLGFKEDWDPTHLNQVVIVTKELESLHPLLKAGDLLVSFRKLNTVALIDGQTRRFKWTSTGVTVEQHSPQFLDGGVLVFDNQGGFRKSGGSRLVWIDLTTGMPKTVFPKPDVPLPDQFFTKFAGRIDVNPDGRRVLVTLTHLGSIWEVDLETGEAPWEYAYAHSQNPGVRRVIFTAQYVHDANFPMNSAEDDR